MCEKCTTGAVPSERNPVRTKVVFDLMEHRFSFCRDFVLLGFRSEGFLFYWDCILIGCCCFVIVFGYLRVTLRLLCLYTTQYNICFHDLCYALIRPTLQLSAESVLWHCPYTAYSQTRWARMCNKCGMSITLLWSMSDVALRRRHPELDTPALSHLSWRTWPCVVGAALFLFRSYMSFQVVFMTYYENTF